MHHQSCGDLTLGGLVSHYYNNSFWRTTYESRFYQSLHRINEGYSTSTKLLLQLWKFQLHQLATAVPMRQPMQPTCPTTPILLLQQYYQPSSPMANNLRFTHLQSLQKMSSLVHALAKQVHALGGLNVEDIIFMALFHWQPAHINIIMDFGKIFFKPRIAQIYTKRRQSPWFKTHGDIISSKPMV